MEWDSISIFIRQISNAFYDRLKKKGADVGEIEQFDGFQGFALIDPDGNHFGVTE